ncbi:toxin-antitoxin system HicB family antitoxin [Citrifermentans bemidjiense]|uniref:toxin-antitoxin system HicB family antitoxin n=1 Tax=Citrifermentans bemidjiense TaxID=225194 RepID=UPI00145C77D7
MIQSKVRLNVEVPEELRARIKIIAIMQGVTMNQLILESLQEKYGSAQVDQKPPRSVQ